jgi:malonyl-CoA O-methyltransferase
MSVQEAYDGWSASYDADRNLTRDLDERVTRQVLGERHFGSIFEAACGTGKNTPFYARIGETVTAMDFSYGMIALARQKVRAGNVSFLLADLRRPWPCAADSFDLVACNLVLEHIEDLSFVFGQAARVLKAGGSLFICELHPFRQYQGKQAVFSGAEGEIKIPAYVHNISDFMWAAEENGLRLADLHEWWHEEDDGKPPRAVSFLFQTV